MSLKSIANLLALYLITCGATASPFTEDTDWYVKVLDDSVALRAYDHDSKTQIMINCAVGQPSAIAVFSDGSGEGMFINLRVDDGEARQFMGLRGEESEGLIVHQLNTESDRWKVLLEQMKTGKFLKILANFHGGDSLSRIPLASFSSRYTEWYSECNARGWVF